MNSLDKEGMELLDILHQLNQPLTAINNYAQAGSAMLAAGHCDPARLRELFDKISDQSARSFEISKSLRKFGGKSSPLDS